MPKKGKSRPQTRDERKTVLIVDDHPIVCHGLRELIGPDNELRVCGMAHGTAQAREMVAQLQPDVILMDVSLGGDSGIDLVDGLRQEGLKTPILMLSVHDESAFAEWALRAGAQGYVMKGESPDALLAAIRDVLEGRIHVSPRVASDILGKLSSHPLETRSGIPWLSGREREVFRLIGQGCATREIAQSLELSIKTVETHRAHIKRKLGIDGSNQLVKRAVEWLSSQGTVATR